uniref:Uncharacterized protein n=1 Tax=Noctiluca scintillans TaxID=2966 RepID=A0A7S1ATR6_NOCSC|mmetsp:Transcript_57911/g.154323  ORF Transcript_57911/g.154323 Transcript_57911/m.154323 type:complete len:161 (+) Transcript_57911:74-556(+)
MVCTTASICVYGALALAVCSLTGCGGGGDCTWSDVCGYSGTAQGVGSSTSCCKSFKTMTEDTCATPDLPTLEAHICAVEQDCQSYTSMREVLTELEADYHCVDMVHGQGVKNSSASRSAKVLQEAIMETLDKQVKTVIISESLATTETPDEALLEGTVVV